MEVGGDRVRRVGVKAVPPVSWQLSNDLSTASTTLAVAEPWPSTMRGYATVVAS